jgi:hypothetical protein
MKINGQLDAPVALSQVEQLPNPIGYKIGWFPQPVLRTWRKEIFCPLL